MNGQIIKIKIERINSKTIISHFKTQMSVLNVLLDYKVIASLSSCDYG